MSFGNPQVISSVGSGLQPTPLGPVPQQSQMLGNQVNADIPPSGNPQSLAGVPVTQLNHLRRFRPLLAYAPEGPCVIVKCGNSHTFGVNADGIVTPVLPSNNTVDAVAGATGQLRKRFAAQYGDPGEGFIWTDTGQDDRYTFNPAAPTTQRFNSPGQAAACLRHNQRLYQAGNSISRTAPAGTTQAWFMFANRAGDIPPHYTINGGADQGAFGGGLSGTGTPLIQAIPWNPGDTIALNWNSGQCTVIGGGFFLQNGQGVQVHRIGVGGYTLGCMTGGDYNGQIGTSDGINYYSAAEIVANIRAHYLPFAARGLLILEFGTNEQTNQLSNGGLHCGFTPLIFAQTLYKVVQQVVADGWCVLLECACPSPSENQSPGAAPLSAYAQIMQQVAQTTDHVAFWDIGDLWGGDNDAAKTATYNAGLRDFGSSHPTALGYSDIAFAEWRILNSVLALGN